jgi:hypothetical protein
MRVVRLKDQQLRRAEVRTSYGEALEKNGGGERARSAEGCTVGRLVVQSRSGMESGKLIPHSGGTMGQILHGSATTTHNGSGLDAGAIVDWPVYDQTKPAARHD